MLVGGRYWVGLGHGILTFPRTEQAILFSIPSMADTDDEPYKNPPLGARTNEGLTFYLQIAIHYKLTTSQDDKIKAQELGKIYSLFGKDWAPFLSAISEAAIKDVSSRHSFEDFYKKREAIGLEIYNELAPEFHLYGIRLTGVYVLNLAFPAELEDAIQSTENAKQEVEKYRKLQTREEILRDTKISLADRKKTMMKAEADSIKNSTTIQQAGEQKAIQTIWANYGLVLKELLVFFCRVNHTLKK